MNSSGAGGDAGDITCLELRICGAHADRLAHTLTCRGIIVQLRAMATESFEDLEKIKILQGSHPLAASVVLAMEREISRTFESEGGATAVVLASTHLKKAEAATADLGRSIEALLQKWLNKAHDVERFRIEMQNASEKFPDSIPAKKLRSLSPFVFELSAVKIKLLSEREVLLTAIKQELEQCLSEKTSSPIFHFTAPMSDPSESDPEIASEPKNETSFPEGPAKWESRLLLLGPSKTTRELEIDLRKLPQTEDPTRRQLESQDLQLQVQELYKIRTDQRRRSIMLAGYQARLEDLDFPAAREIIPEVKRLEGSEDPLREKEWPSIFRELERLKKEEKSRILRREAVLQGRADQGYLVEEERQVDEAAEAKIYRCVHPLRLGESRKMILNQEASLLQIHWTSGDRNLVSRDQEEFTEFLKQNGIESSVHRQSGDLSEWKCTDCGETNPGTFVLCESCGKELPAIETEYACSIWADGQCYPCREEEILGREGSIARPFFRAHPSVSRRHVRLFKSEKFWCLEVMDGTTNPCWFQGEKIEKGSYIRIEKDGDLRLSQSCLVRLALTSVA